MEDTRGLRTTTTVRKKKKKLKILEGVVCTGHEGYDSHVGHFPPSRPFSRVFIVRKVLNAEMLLGS
jgi:hypothetical protein